MGNAAVFVDAGYLYKQGSTAQFGLPLGRKEVHLDAQGFVSSLWTWLQGRYERDDLLRTYWYDGAPKGVASSDQHSVAALAFVKLRLGRINSAGQQKGVDTLIVRDLMVLSQERSIERAVVISGDEDLREGIEYAQDRGVMVTVVGIDADGRSNQSVELVRGADESLTLPKDFLTPCLERREVGAPIDFVSARAIQSIHTVAVATNRLSVLASDATVDRYGMCGSDFAVVWLAKATAEEVRAITDGYPRLPKALDAELLQYAVRTLGEADIEEDNRRVLRRSFWAKLDISS